MSKELSFSGSKKIEERRKEAEQFIKAVVDPDEYPYFVSDAATVYDISLLSGEELRLRIERVYGIRLTEEDLTIPVWRLLDRLEDLGSISE